MNTLHTLIPEYYPGVANTPTFHGIVDSFDTKRDSDILWERRGKIFRASKGGDIVAYLSSDGKDTHGFGGAPYVLHTAEGVHRFNGAWSSRAEVVNSFYPDRPIIQEVALKDNDGRGWLACGVTIEGILRAFHSGKRTHDFTIAVVKRMDSARLEPIQNGMVKLCGDRKIEILKHIYRSNDMRDSDLEQQVTEVSGMILAGTRNFRD